MTIKNPSCPWQCPAVTGCASCTQCQSACAWPQGRALVKRLKGIFTAGPRVKSAKGHHAHTNNKPFPEASSHTTMSAAAEMPHQAHGSLRRLSCAHPRQGGTPEMLMPEFFHHQANLHKHHSLKDAQIVHQSMSGKYPFIYSSKILTLPWGTTGFTLGWNQSVTEDNTFFFSSLLTITRICLATVCPWSAVKDLLSCQVCQHQAWSLPFSVL